MNEPHERKIRNYLEYILDHWRLVAQNKMNHHNLQTIQEKLLKEVPIVVNNMARKVYEIEKLIL